MHLTILTGASRGLGRGIAEQLLARGHHVLALSRKPAEIPAPSGSRLTAWAVDLADAAPVAQRLHTWLVARHHAQDEAQITSATLINNAGVVSQLAPLSHLDADDLINALRVGLEAPALLTSAFLRATETWAVPRKVILVSSGLGRRAMASSATYCAAKAGLDHLARAVALEEAAKTNGARIVSLAPGVIDTDMQVQLRSADAALFPDRANFTAMKTEGRLDSPRRRSHQAADLSGPRGLWQQPGRRRARCADAPALIQASQAATSAFSCTRSAWRVYIMWPAS